jgi:hypothetical protein
MCASLALNYTGERVVDARFAVRVSHVVMPGRGRPAVVLEIPFEDLYDTAADSIVDLHFLQFDMSKLRDLLARRSKRV